MRRFFTLMKILTASHGLRRQPGAAMGNLSVAWRNKKIPDCTTTTITNNQLHSVNDPARAGSFFLSAENAESTIHNPEFLAQNSSTPFNMAVYEDIYVKIKDGPVKIIINWIKKFLRHTGIFTIALLIANLFFVQKSFGQTATVTFDYTGATFTCGTDNTYTPSSTSLTVSTTGIPSGATITGISFKAVYGVAFGTTNITFTLNGTSIGGFSATTATCVTGTISSVSIPLFNKTGPNTLAVTISGGTFPGVSNGVFTVTYTNCSAITASATKSDISCFNASNGTIVVSGSGGTTPYTFSINNGTNYQASGTFNGLSPGQYLIRVKDSNGCESKPSQ
ncbi:MAG TPA: SprB repeat-containing protein [Chitinophagaceae bacterium]|nr:SprB repeat-containing protein [Chitinophagaceae bacterium]